LQGRSTVKRLILSLSLPAADGIAMTELLQTPAAQADATPQAFRRLAVYEAPTVESLVVRLGDVAPGVVFAVQEQWALPPVEDGVPVWHWSSGIGAFSRQAGPILRDLIFPMLATDQPCCFAFDFPREELGPRALDPASLALLDLEDIGRLFALDVVEETFSLLPELRERVTLTPIERMLQDALFSAGVDARPQVKFGRYRLDFLVERDGRQIGIEADGRDFHDAERDARRDEELVGMGIEAVLRFTGSEIWLDADGCAAKVAAYLSGQRQTRRGIPRQSLDDSQLAAIRHNGGAARVLAPAGAGKTRVLVNRIAELVDRGVEPSSILALAFNKKANEQLVKRLQEDMHLPVSATKLFDPDNRGVVCANFNAFGYRYQRELLSLHHDVKTASGVWRKLMERAVHEGGATLRGAKRGSDPLREFLRALDRVRHDLASPDDLIVEFDTFDGPASITPFAPIYAAYQRLRIDAGIQSFDDQVHVAVTDMLLNPRNREFVQSRFQHVLVDEYQDLNATQLALVDIVSRPSRNLFVVGDDDQLIYGWLFANVTNILRFHDRVPARPCSATYVLSTNYRSSRAVVEASRRVIDHNQNREVKQIRPAQDAAEGEVRYVRSSSWRERADEIVMFLQQHKRPRSDYRDLAVLCRYKAQQPFVALALDLAGIPRTQLLAYRLFSDPGMQLLRAYVALVRDPGGIDGPTLKLLLNRPTRYLTNALVDALCSAEEPWQDLSAAIETPPCPPSLKDLHARVNALHERWEKSKPTSASLLEDVVGGFGLDTYWRDARAQAQRDKDDADALHLLALIRLQAIEIPDHTEFLAFWDAKAREEEARFGTATDDLARELNPTEDQVVIGTMHSSKGREYDAVVLYDYDVDLTTLSAAEVEEERRVFYVGLTRARESALITIDGTKEGLPQFVRESIAPRAEHEEAAVHAKLAELQRDEGDLVVAGVRIKHRLDAVTSGAESERCSERRAVLVAEMRPLEEELEQLAPFIEEPTLWARVRGHTAQARRRADVLVAALQSKENELEPLTYRIDLLRGDPAVIATPIEDELQRSADALEAVRERQRACRGRLTQLELIGSTR
jgi:DNA helicase II / ATP-dependent DNA helicase PcrA